MNSLDSPSYLKKFYPHILLILKEAQKNFDTFNTLSQENKTINHDISYQTLLIYLSTAQQYVEERMHSKGRFSKLIESILSFEGITKAIEVVKLCHQLIKRNKTSKPALFSLTPNITTIYEYPKEQQKVIRSRKKKSIELNGVSAVDVTVRKHTNLQEPILDLQVILNNPIGRLWLALKRIWKSQATVITLRFSIPLLVLPICFFVLWSIWKGNQVTSPIIKYGVIQPIPAEKETLYLLKLQTNDAYILTIPETIKEIPLNTEVYVSGIANQTSQTINVTQILSTTHTIQSEITVQKNNSVLEEIWNFLQQFY